MYNIWTDVDINFTSVLVCAGALILGFLNSCVENVFLIIVKEQ